MELTIAKQSTLSSSSKELLNECVSTGALKLSIEKNNSARGKAASVPKTAAGLIDSLRSARY